MPTTQDILQFHFSPTTFQQSAQKIIPITLTSLNEHRIDKLQKITEEVGASSFSFSGNNLIPQVFRNTLPAIGNEFVINIKDTSVLNVIAVSELFFATKTVAGANFRFFETFMITCVIYFVMTFTVTRILRYLEKRLDGDGTYAPYANQMQTSKLERKDER